MTLRLPLRERIASAPLPVSRGRARPDGGVVTQRTANPCTPVRFRLGPPLLAAMRSAALAQLVEHIIRNDGVRCSSHLSGTTSSQTAELSRFPTRSLHDCDTRTPHAMLGQSCSSPWKDSETRVTERRTKVRHTRGSGVALRGQIYQFRIRVPKDVRDVIGKKHLSRSLRTDSLTVANRLAVRCAIEATAIFEEARSSSPSNMPRVVLNGFQDVVVVSFGELCRGYLDDPTSSRTEKSLHAYRSSLSVLVEIIGATKLARDIDRATCRDAMQVLRALPSNARKRWPNEALRDIAARSVKDGLQTMSAANVNEYMNKLSTVLNWGVREEYCLSNPAKGLRLPRVTSAKSRRDAFAPEQLVSIFNAPLYRGCQNDERGYAIEGEERPRRSRFWVPLLSLFCGLRLNEACQLLVGDIREDEGVLCIFVSADEGGKSLKTLASNRKVPVHPELLEIGFAAFHSQAQARHDARLFPEIQQDAFGMYSGRFSKWFSRFLVTCGAAVPRTCFHSFRHSFRDALRNGRVDREIALALGGWTLPSGLNAVGDAYGNGFDVTLLRSELAKAQYPFLDLSHLKRSRG